MHNTTINSRPWLALSATITLAVPLCTSMARAAPRPDRYREVRLQMVRDYIESEGITDRRVLAALRNVPRHEFVPRRLRAKAYRDGALPIGHGQTISPPFIVAYMTEAIDPQPDDRVLEIGTGSGYQAAVLAKLVKHVFTIEIVDPLGRAAHSRLKELGYENVSVRVGDGYKGWPEEAPFDKIIVTCSPEQVPQPLVDQLIEGGRIIIPLGRRYQQVFHLLEKQDGKLVETKLIPTLFVPMTGISEQQRTTKPDPLNPQVVNGGFEEDRNADGRADGWHYQRQVRLAKGPVPQGEFCFCFENQDSGDLSQALQGMAVDGRSIEKLRIAVWASYEETAAGSTRFAKPALVLHFYDDSRRSIGQAVLGPWLGNDGWRAYAQTFDVPLQTREMILRIGLNGATGRLYVDNVQLTPLRRAE